MSCILCFTLIPDGESLSIHDFSEVTKMTAMELINKHFNFSEQILTEEVVENSETYLCKNCWTHLENFNDFYNFVADNYDALNDSKEDKYLIANEYNASDLIVYDEEVDKDTMDQQMIKVEVLNDSEYIETEWIEEDAKVPTKKAKKIPSLPTPKVSRQPVATVLDSADDQRIRETANMYCDICHEQLDSLREAKSHYKLSHVTEGYIVCCERKFKQRCRLVEHVNTHFNYTYSCNICAKTFDSKSYLAKHQACHDEFKQYECAHCPKAFSRKFQVRNHLLSVHIFDNVEPNLECPVEGCNKKFVNQARLKHHVDYTHSTNHLEICEICTKQFRTKNAIEEHMKTHARRDEDRIRCEICGHYLADLKSYNRHVKNHGTEKLDNTCSYCGKKSPNLNALKKHIKYVHEMTKSYPCRFCEKSFKRPRNLWDHEAAMHTLQDLYACTFCSKTFRNQSNMLAHRKKQHPDQYQKPKYMRDSL